MFVSSLLCLTFATLAILNHWSSFYDLFWIVLKYLHAVNFHFEIHVRENAQCYISLIYYQIRVNQSFNVPYPHARKKNYSIIIDNSKTIDFAPTNHSMSPYTVHGNKIELLCVKLKAETLVSMYHLPSLHLKSLVQEIDE